MNDVIYLSPCKHNRNVVVTFVVGHRFVQRMTSIPFLKCLNEIAIYVLNKTWKNVHKIKVLCLTFFEFNASHIF
jgi:hypothetical protein